MSKRVKKIDDLFLSINKNKISSISGKDIAFLEYIVKNKSEFYREKQLLRKGKIQTIYPSIYGLKPFQRSLVDFLSDRIKFLDCVQGSVRNKSTKTNSKKHRGKMQVLSLDIKNFFPSITKDMVLKSFLMHGMDLETAEFVTEVCTYKGLLQIGPPSSPFIANLVLMPLDFLLQRFCKKQRLTYTRYVDDISISGDRTLHPYFGTIKKYINQSGFELAEGKTSFMGRNAPQIVTKIVVNEKMRPTREYLSNFRKSIRSRWIAETDEDLAAFKKSAWGKIRYVKHYDKKIARELRGLLVKIPK